jgi:hypothetical protein
MRFAAVAWQKLNLQWPAEAVDRNARRSPLDDQRGEFPAPEPLVSWRSSPADSQMLLR